MEKLILRGVMWGADKIPDPWFEKIPGGYYKAKQQADEKIDAVEKRETRSSDMKKRRSSQRRRHSDDEYDDYYDDEERPDRDAGYRSEGHNGRQADMRKSYDGGADYDEINDRPRRRRSRPRRRRDNDKYGHDDGYGRAPRNVRPGADGVEYGTGVVPPPQSGTAPMRDPYAAGAATAAAAAGQNPYGSPAPSQQAPSINNSQNEGPAPQLTSTLRGGMATGYVPYAHIYGGPPNPQGQPGFAPPPSESGSVQPNFMNQIAAPAAAPGVRPHPQPGYQQNPYAQEAIPGSQPAYIPDPYAQARRLDQQQYDQRRNNEYTSSEDEAYSKPRSRRTRSRRSRRDRSSSRDRYSDDDSYHDRRTHSERPPPPKNTTNMADHRGSNKVRPPPPNDRHVHSSSSRPLGPPSARNQPPPSSSRRKEEARSREHDRR